MKRSQIRRWSLYRRPRSSVKGTKWERISQLGTSKGMAVRYFQSRLLANATGDLDPTFEYRIRSFIPEVGR